MAALALVAGLAIICLAADMLKDGNHFSRHSLLASGEIVGVRESGGAQNGFSFHPVVRFSTKEGEVVTAVADEHMGSEYATGQKVDVYYEPAMSSHVQIGTRARHLAPVLFFFALGGVLILVGAMVHLSSPSETRVQTWLGKLVSTTVPALGVFGVIGGVTAVVTEALEERDIKAKRGRCSRDADCPSTFCDRGLCAPNFGETPHFGKPCSPNLVPTGKERGDEAMCGPFACIEGRCRSCANDDECQPGIENGQVCLGTYWGLSACDDHPGGTEP